MPSTPPSPYKRIPCRNSISALYILCDRAVLSCKRVCASLSGLLCIRVRVQIISRHSCHSLFIRVFYCAPSRVFCCAFPTRAGPFPHTARDIHPLTQLA
ncbi:hypothetical protein PLICRDRAFT_330270 [Plicaturopsis crispa FD-325 SS-3]|uniref:Uncharacterized protein n=1 Tax=Plicaturopsis crispa FD-325 SS-3 TaxID=944288 RepID=A0A0C9T6W3_PLICR|nr:hypothetical protein PLICRDRAFT_330270 [Plicaturopsis crispa FD-325 SS-3]